MNILPLSLYSHYLITTSFTIVSPQVITSKQRPRKLTIVGGDGRKYMFLLKGHEDLRQDERVMQFFRDRFNRKIAASLVLTLTF